MEESGREPDAFDAIVMADERNNYLLKGTAHNESLCHENPPSDIGHSQTPSDSGEGKGKPLLNKPTRKPYDRFHGEGYQEGYAEGINAGVIEGRQYGVQQGANIGLEIGSYLGFAVTWKKLLHAGSDEKHSKKAKVLESLIEMIEKFPYEDPVYERLQDDLEKIRGRFKQACSLLHIPSDGRLGSGGSALTF